MSRHPRAAAREGAAKLTSFSIRLQHGGKGDRATTVDKPDGLHDKNLSGERVVAATRRPECEHFWIFSVAIIDREAKIGR
jgi:hypothetical protein